MRTTSEAQTARDELMSEERDQDFDAYGWHQGYSRHRVLFPDGSALVWVEEPVPGWYVEGDLNADPCPTCGRRDSRACSDAYHRDGF